MKVFQSLLISIHITLIIGACEAQENQASDSVYTFEYGDPNGIGKWYMGREIAHVMSFQGMDWLNRLEREQEENVSLLIKNMEIQPTDVIADIGAGSGYHVFKMAPIASKGKVYAVDIQQEMLDAIENENDSMGFQNIMLVKGGELSSNLPDRSIDKLLMVDVYHEFSYPKEMLNSLHRAMKEDGFIYLIEYRKEDPNVPIKTIHKMTEKQAIKEFEASGFQLVENISNLPWQHCMVFRKKG